MKKTLIGGIVAGALALTLVGGNTFAAWTDSYADLGNASGASYLEVDVTSPSSASFDKLNLVPGGADYESFIVSSDAGGAVPAANLALVIENLIDAADTCTNNSSEAAVDDCEAGGPGDFSDAARITVNTSLPTSNLATACDSGVNPRGSALPGSVVTLQDLRDFGSLNVLRDGPDAGTAPDTLAPGQGICVAMAITLPATAGDSVQGDSASFDVKFNLTQPAV